MDQVTRDIATLLCLAAFFGYINHRWLKLPRTIGLVIIALFASLAAVGIDQLVPGWGVGPGLRAELIEIDFSATLMEGLLSFLLFAGALHVDLNALAARKWAIGVLATLGLLLATTIVGTTMWLVFDAVGVGIPFIYCLLFGALISPTDPVAVLGILKSAKVPPRLEAKIAGESLFNDGVGVVIFTVLLGLVGAQSVGTQESVIVDAVILFAEEALGGILLGLLTGGIAFFALRTIDEHNLEVIITLALVTGSYEIAQLLHTSGPIAVVVAGLIIGNHGRRYAMSDRTRERLSNFWTVVDEILNAVLFLLIGLEVVLIPTDTAFLWAGLIAIPVVLAARFVSVGLPIRVLNMWRDFTPGAVPVLTWGGLRGGISVALALSMPPSPERDLILTVCYAVVVFSIIVQGLTIGPLARRLVPPDETSPDTH